MKKFEFTLSNGLKGYYRTAPAFMRDGVRVFYKRPFGQPGVEGDGFNGMIFPDEMAACDKIAHTLNLQMTAKYITEYTVTNC